MDVPAVTPAKRSCSEPAATKKSLFLADLSGLTSIEDLSMDAKKEFLQNLFWCRSVKLYERNVEKYQNYCKSFGLDETKKESVAHWLLSPEIRRYKTSTTFTMLSCVKKWFGVFQNLDLKKDYSLDLIMKQKMRNEESITKKATTFTRDEMESWLLKTGRLRTVYSSLQRLWVMIGLYGCARLSEIERVKFEDVKLHGESCLTVTLRRYLSF
jgi:site-specific recombinase XerD